METLLAKPLGACLVRAGSSNPALAASVPDSSGNRTSPVLGLHISGNGVNQAQASYATERRLTDAEEEVVNEFRFSAAKKS
jgi:hypothetical protein